MMNLRGVVGACVLLSAVFIAGATSASAQQSGAGRVKVATGEAFIIRGGQSIPAKVGQTVLASDSLKTGASGALGVTLNDNTRVSLGASSELRLVSFAYDPGAGRLGIVIKFIKGVAAYVSGRIAKLSPDSIRLETPAAIVGVRGTTLTIRVAE